MNIWESTLPTGTFITVGMSAVIPAMFIFFAAFVYKNNLWITISGVLGGLAVLGLIGYGIVVDTPARAESAADLQSWVSETYDVDMTLPEAQKLLANPPLLNQDISDTVKVDNNGSPVYIHIADRTDEKFTIEKFTQSPE